MLSYESLQCVYLTTILDTQVVPTCKDSTPETLMELMHLLLHPCLI